MFEEIWDNPEAAYALYVDKKNRFMVIPSSKMVTDNHVLVIPAEPVSLVDDLPDARYRQLWELVRITRQHLARTLQPGRGVGTCVWGNQVSHTHVHVIARNQPHDGEAFFDPNLALTTPEALKAVQRRLAFPPVLQKEAEARVTAAGL